jgi:hypothetical protein
MSHLILWNGPFTLIAVPDRVEGPEEAASIAEAPATASVTPFAAPYWLAGLRLHEAIVGLGPGGDPVAEAWSAPLHLSRPAFPPGLRLPESGRLPDLLDVDLPAPGGPPCPTLSPGGGPSILDPAIARAVEIRLAPATRPVIRDAFVTRGPVHLLLRPFHLVKVDRGEGAARLVDGASRSVVAVLSGDETRRLEGAVTLHPATPSGRVAFRPMRCPVCASRLALAERGELRFCPACRRALEVTGERLTPVSYRAETRKGPKRSLLPFWRFSFQLDDPRDGRTIRSVAELAEAAGGAPAGSSPAVPFLDVPAFRPEGTRRAFPGLSALPSVSEPPSAELVEGPVRGEAGFADPSRFAALSSASAALVARHALLLSIPKEVVARAAPRRLDELVFRAPLRLDPPSLVLRSLRPDALSR